MSSSPTLARASAGSRLIQNATTESYPFENAVRRALAPMALGRLRVDLPDGRTCEFGEAPVSESPLPLDIPATAVIHVRSPSFFKKCIFSGDIGFAEAYMDGDWDSPDLTAVVAWFIRNLENSPTLSGSRRAQPFAQNFLRFVNRLGQHLRANSLVNARRNIREHYDLSNDFFSLFLDPSMMYSSALWTQPGLTLEEAQREKNDALCRQLRLKPSDHVLEIGSGWGGWSIHAARTYGCRVTTVTISQEQYDFARRRVAHAGLGDRVEVRLQDYREIEGRFDKLVSIEMLEAVGHDYQPEYFAACSRLLKPDGLLALQFITCPDARYNELRRGVDFIQKHVFPGSLLISLNRVNDLLSRAGGFSLHAMMDFGTDYARTLRLWHDAFNRRLTEVRALGFDERFIRKWNYYLCYCEAAFALRNISVVQTLHTRANNLGL